MPESKHIEAVYNPSEASKPEEFLKPIPISDPEYFVRHANELAAEVARLRCGTSHHAACDCREAQFARDTEIARLAREYVTAHLNGLPYRFVSNARNALIAAVEKETSRGI